MQTQNKNIVTQDTQCFHCGDTIRLEKIDIEDKVFCCSGCVTVYQILKENNLENYYKYQTNPGSKKVKEIDYSFLLDPKIEENLLKFKLNSISSVELFLPQIHCASCVWLLENLYKLNENIKSVEINFIKKIAYIQYDHSQITLQEISILLQKIGYPPKFNLSDLDKAIEINPFRKYYYSLGVAFFAFGNIMLLSFPEYFGLNSIRENKYYQFFGYVNFLLSLPVLLFSASEFFKSAYNGLRLKSLNMDFPIVLGILIMFLRSSYEIFSHTGPGYMDTLASLVFLMLIGRMFQNKSYDNLNYDRDFKSFFPIAVNIKEGLRIFSKNVSEIKVNDVLIIKNEEIIPVDSILLSEKALIDYSFVKGEYEPVFIEKESKIWSGGKNIGKSIEVKAENILSQSYLTKLWNNEIFQKEHKEKTYKNLATRLSKWFTLIVILISIFTLAFWYFYGDIMRGINAFTAILIITCPCALALSTPFTIGNTLRLFGNNKFYLKNANVVEKLNDIETIVFDKTGTLTLAKEDEIEWVGNKLSNYEKQMIYSVASQSNHPLSKSIAKILEKQILEISEYIEIVGKGISAKIGNYIIKLGSNSFINESDSNSNLTEVYIKINGIVLGKYIFNNKYREGLSELILNLKKNYQLYLISGDNDKEYENLKKIFSSNGENLSFNFKPQDKLDFISNLQRSNKNVLMIGDGLNDAGALKQANVGIALSDDTNNFTPSCDAILDSKNFKLLNNFLRFSKYSVSIVKASFIISFIYNLIGIYFAIQGTLSPLIAAILMPISSVTILAFTTGMIRLKEKMIQKIS